MTETVKVMVRCRPINDRERELKCQNVINVHKHLNQINVTKPKSQELPKSFTFDCVFGPDSLQSDIYEQSAFSVVDSVLEGYNGTVFAYGQTGCGKTYTMMGETKDKELWGIIPRTFNQIITIMNSETETRYLVRCSFMQIYNEEIHDLLGKDAKAKMDLKESPTQGIFVKDLSANIVKNVEEMEKWMKVGLKNRAIRETAMNKQSSRSHTIFTIHIESEEMDELGNERFRAGKLNLVDLAGSERQSKTHAVGDGLKEATKINLSLSALGNVISALVDGKTHHIPYRDSKLTRLLQDSLGGNTKTIMIANISPASNNYEETLSTLRYASRAKFIKNKPVINEDPKDALLRQYADQIKRLKMMLQGRMPQEMNILSHSEQKSIMKPILLDLSDEKEREEQVVYQEDIPNEIQYIEIDNSEQLKNQLQERENCLKISEEENLKLKEQLDSLQKLVSKDNYSEADNKKQLEKMNKLKEKLKAKKKKEEEWKAEKKQREEDLLNIQKSYQSLNEEVEEMRVRFQELKTKYQASMQEITDIRRQAQQQKEELLDIIRFQQTEISKYSGICKMLLNEEQIEEILIESEYYEEDLEWEVAPFYLRDHILKFPKISTATSKILEAEKKKKEVVFVGVPERKNKDKLIVNIRPSDIVRNAREEKEDGKMHGDFNQTTCLKNKKKKDSPVNSETSFQDTYKKAEMINSEEERGPYEGKGHHPCNKKKLHPINNLNKRQLQEIDWNQKRPVH